MSNDGRVTDPSLEPCVDTGSQEPATTASAQADARRSLFMSVTGLGGAILLAVLSVLPMPFAIGVPGPTHDTLSIEDGIHLVEVNGAPTYESTGELRLTTVSVSRGSSQPFTLGRVLRAWGAEGMYAAPEEDVLGTRDEQDQFNDRAAQDWITSQESAAVAALEALGEEVPATLRIAGVDPSSQASGLLDEDDVIVAVDGAPALGFSDLSDAMEDRAPGDEITVAYRRGGEEAEVTFATIDDGTGRAIMGLWMDPEFELPVNVEVAIDRVGGPSAGLMFSLAIMEFLTPGDQLNGARIAGTGAINADGTVVPIGGIRLKMHGAVAAGSDYFLAPEANCAEVVGHVPEGLDVYSVTTLDDAADVVRRIGAGDVDGLATCTA